MLLNDKAKLVLLAFCSAYIKAEAQRPDLALIELETARELLDDLIAQGKKEVANRGTFAARAARARDA